MQYDVENEFKKLRLAVMTLEKNQPNQVVQVLVAPGAGVAASNRAAPIAKAVLRRVILKRGSKELWVELGAGSVRPSGSRPWNPVTMRVDVTGLQRELQWPPVEFVVVDH
ncbi:TPA: hypothetical protein QDB11_005600 [Burkholderia vietnamiensis]|uniref:hypothetical protein n=1 Tax=Burkholderia vietnamiensis TaxID=60552 RepID=UPI00264A5065|nr:hypothetical protein [Burkholderia vietnamiensis]MDN8114912.1 hypothetical protein [Burkholderia vietnamiensis]HDR9140869.1 hypothetical protein [Burkholderia vietnamiensis]